MKTISTSNFMLCVSNGRYNASIEGYYRDRWLALREFATHCMWAEKDYNEKKIENEYSLIDVRNEVEYIYNPAEHGKVEEYFNNAGEEFADAWWKSYLDENRE